MRATGIGRSAVVAIALASGLIGGTTAAAADQTAARPWSVSHGGASASGTANFVKNGILGGKLTVEGTLQVNDSDCYVARMTISNDLAPVFVTVAEQCGQGTEPIDDEFPIVSNVWNASITICRTGNDCGQPDPIY